MPDESRGGMFGSKKQLETENEELRQALASLGVAERDQLHDEINALHEQLGQLRSEVAAVHTQLVEDSEAAMLQEVGVYRYTHPLADAVAYKAALDTLQAQIKDAIRTKQAVVGATNWTVNNSAAEGRKMVTDFCKLMLRAYNNEADNAVRSLKPYKLAAAKDRLFKTRDTIERLGRTMNITVTNTYHGMRLRELELTADYVNRLAVEKEAEREEKARLREEAAAQREIEREQAKLDKERSHYETALAALREKGDEQAIAEAEAKLAEIEAAKQGLADRAANTRAGYVYVISNLGAFGPRMVKIGMTRRLEPMDRVRELGDASVPFRYDVHAMIFSHDAVGLETSLHQRFAAQRVNWVNTNREFFYVTPSDVRDALVDLQGDLLTYVEDAEALEWHQSESARSQVPANT
jgi:hypothetical protein